MADRFKKGSYHTGRRFVRRGFVDHLHHALVQYGILTFHDDSKLERCADIQSKLYEAIQSSELSIVTFSSGYATSRWCLDELLKIMECRTLSKHLVLPIFYDVDHGVVRNQSGVYTDAFEVLEVLFKEDLDRVKKWREALRAAADLAGFVLHNQADGHEAKFIQNVVKEVIKKLDRGRLNVPRNIVGVESIVENITKWLRDGYEDVEVGLIYGLGGVGKTTIAKIVYNNNCDNFDGYSFLADIRRVSRQDNGFVRLQRQLISNISRDEVGEIYNIDEGMVKIFQVIGSRRILLVLDDVDEVEKLYGMFDYPEWFFPGSKIIVTTRNQHLGNVCMPIKKFKVCPLNVEKSTRLFCLRAFRHDHPLQSYMKILEQFIQYCDGLPLALEVLATSLCGKALEMWESQLAKLEDFPIKNLFHNVLELSFDSIEDGNDKDIFLHIAFFLVWERQDYAFKILEGCRLHTEIGFQNLVDRCLVTVDDYGNVMMHQLIQEMGREVVRREAYSQPGRRSRLWNHKETCNVLRNKEGTTAIKGIRLAFPAPNNVQIYEDIYTKAEHYPKNIGLSCILPTHSRRVHINLESVKTDACKEMKNINLLQLENVQLKGSYGDFPKALICLWWHGCPLETIPEDLDLYKLAVLDMRNSCLVHAWEGIKGVYHGGAYYVILPGDQVAQWFTEVKVGLELSYTVPCISEHQVCAFNICCVPVFPMIYSSVGMLEIKNWSRKWTWFYSIQMWPFSHVAKKGIFTLLTHWCVMKHRELKEGDELQIKFMLKGNSSSGSGFEHVLVKYGIKILYEESEDNETCENCVKEAIQEEGNVEVEQKHKVAVWYDDTFRKNVDLSLFERDDYPGFYVINSNIVT